MVRHNPRRPKTTAGPQRPTLKPLSLTGDPTAQPLGPAPLGPAPLGPSPLGPAPLGPAPLGPAPQAELCPAPADGQQGFADPVYMLAAAIFQNNHRQKPACQQLIGYGQQDGSALPKVQEAGLEWAAYELAFNTLKYQELLEDILIDSCFYLSQPMPDEQMSLVVVMLYDFQDRKFLPREHRGAELIQEVRDVEDCLHRLATRLAASLARCRIKHDLLAIDCILPLSLRENQERASSLPLYAWVNPLKSSEDEVQEVLRRAGFTRAPTVEELSGLSFCPDPRCRDTLAFPPGVRGPLHATALLSHRKLVLQERLCCLGPHAVLHLLGGEGDVLLAGRVSGLSVARTAGLVAGGDRGDRGGRGGCRVLVCVGGRTDQQLDQLQGVLDTMGCKNVVLIPQELQALEGGDPRLQGVRVVLLTPQCSVSAISSPVDFLLRENGDRSLLPYLSQGAVAQGKLEALVDQQTKDLHHALSFPKVRAVVYCTFSLFPEENEEVVWRCLDQNQTRTQQDGQPRWKHYGPSPVLPGVLAVPEGCGKPFFRLEPTAHSNGCFLAILTREPEPVVQETPQEVLSRANAKGLLDKIGVSQPAARRPRKGAATRPAREAPGPRALQPHASGGPPPRPGPPRGPEARGGSLPPGLELQGWTNRRPGLQAKAPCWQSSKAPVSSPSAREAGDGLRPAAEPQAWPGAAQAPPSALNPFLTRAGPPTAPPTHPATALAAAAARARPCLVMKPLALSLPPVQLPVFQPANHSRAGAGPAWGGSIPSFSCHRWKPAASQVGVQPARSSLSRDLLLQPRPWL